MSFDTWKDEYRADLKRTQEARVEVLKDTAPVDLNAGVDVSKHVDETPVEAPITEQRQAKPEQTLLFDPKLLANAAEKSPAQTDVPQEPALASAPVAPVIEPSSDILVSRLKRLPPEQVQQVLLFVEELSGNDLEP